MKFYLHCDLFTIWGAIYELGQFLFVSVMSNPYLIHMIHFPYFASPESEVEQSPLVMGQRGAATTQQTIALRSGPYLAILAYIMTCLLYTSPSPRDGLLSRMPSSA